MNERGDFIVQMEASGLAPTWDTIYDLNVTVAALRADLATVERERDRYRAQMAAARNALSDVLDWATSEGEIDPMKAVIQTARDALSAITSDEEKS